MHSHKHCAVTLATTLALAGLSASASAQTVTPNPPVIVTPPPSTAAPYPPTVVAESKTVRPNVPLLGAGLATVAIGYAPALIVGIVSDHKGDDKLFIPVVGPWLDMGQRGCDTGEFVNCGSSGIETAALIVDGAVQGIGALAFVGGLLTTQHKTVVHTAARADANKPRVQFAPTSMGGHGYGLTAAGTF
jgi:hypothetical protein